MAFNEDLDLFFDTEDGFADTCTVDGKAGIKANFSMSHVEITIGHAPFSGLKPTLYGKYSDFTGKYGKTVKIDKDGDGDEDSFKILDIESDGTGTCLVILQEL